MIRHRCAACGHPINRTDHFFEPSDGTLCAACLTRLAPGGPHAKKVARPFVTPPLAWACLPELVLQHHEQG